MSNKVRKQVENRILGKRAGTRKCVLLSMADRASDDGSGVWFSKRTLAAVTGFGETAIKDACRCLLSEGLIEETGRMPCRSGYTIIYSINLASVEALPHIKDDEAWSPVTPQDSRETPPTQSGNDPQDSRETPPNHPLNHPITIHYAEKEETYHQVKKYTRDEISSHLDKNLDFGAFVDGCERINQ